MKQGWKYKKLGEAATFINGYAFKPDQWKEYGTPIVRIQNLNNPNAPYNYFDGEVPDKVKIQNGDLLISWSASLGAYIWNGGNAFLNQHIFKVAFDKTDVDKIYLKYAVTSKLETMAGKVHGATMKHIVKKDFDNTLIPYPPKSTQLSIVSELDKINELIRLKKEQLKDYENLAQSIFYEMFGDPVENDKGWEVKELGQLCEVTSSKRVFINEVVDAGVPFIRGTELTALNKLVPGEKMHYTLFITQEHYERLKAITGVPKVGDLLIPSINADGIVWMVDTEKPLYFKDGRVLWIHVNHNHFNSIAIQKLMNILIKNIYASMGGATFAELKLFVLRNMKVPIPPLSVQDAFAEKIKRIDIQKLQVKKSITDLETLLASRMQYWFE